VVVLFLKMFLVSCYQGYHRLRFVAFTNPEDAAVFRRIAQAAERPQVIRAAKVWANDLENIPMFFALGGLAVALEAATLPVLWLSVVFTVARVLHTLAYLRGLQPWRTLFYGIGVICLLGFCSLITARIGG
jgi:uncharacterized MAPEG superfamily protein